MDVALNNDFCEMSMRDIMEINGGVNGWAIASGVLSIAGGAFALAAATADPEPVSKTYAYYSGGCWIASGVTGIIAAF